MLINEHELQRTASPKAICSLTKQKCGAPHVGGASATGECRLFAFRI